MILMSRPVIKNNSKYCYEDGVLINHYNIHDSQELHAFTRDVTTYKISKLTLDHSFIKNYFDVKSYLNIHKYLFEDIFPFAGDVRTESIYKSNEPYFTDDFRKTTIFATPMSILPQLKDHLNKMKIQVRFIKTRDDLLDYIAYFYGEINMIHPFREGNGRTLRTYFKLLVDYLNQYFPEEMEYQELDYSLWSIEDREELLKSTIICSINGDCSFIRESFDKVLVSKEIEKKKSR